MAEVKAETITSLAQKYEVSRQTLYKWLKPISNALQKIEGCRTFTPAQVKMIYDHLGPFPDDDINPNLNNHEKN